MAMGLLSSLLGSAGVDVGGGGILGQLGNSLSQNSGALLGFASGGPEGMVQGKQADMRAALMREEKDKQARQLQAAQALAQSQHLPPELAQLSPDVLAQIVGKKFMPKELSFEERQFNALNPEQQAQYRQQHFLNGGNDYGLNPIYGTDDQGNTVVGQLGKNGTMRATQLPNGFKVSSGVDKVDAGTAWIVMDKRTGQPIATVPKNVAEKEEQEKMGAARAGAKIDLPSIEDNARLMQKTISDVEGDATGMKYGTGLTGQIAGAIPGTPTYAFKAKVEQLQGQTFLQAYKTLRGSGAITDIEGKKGEMAIARLDRAQSEPDFRAALSDLKEVINIGLTRARKSAGSVQPGSNRDALKSKYGLE
jgi:hypothetical protein